MKRHTWRYALIGGPALLLASTALGGENTTTMAVSMTVPVNCTVSATPLSFPTSVATIAVNATSTISISCPSGLPYNVALNAGTHFNSNRRRMGDAGNVNFIAYTLSKTAGGAVWGDSGFGNTFTAGTPVAGTGSGTTQTLTVFGQTLATSGIPAGSYTDSIVVTVHF
jgi:spore coat protein U-like protein